MNSGSDSSSRGSLTVEAVLIIPIIIFVLFWLVNIAFVLYQYAALQSIANEAVEAAQRGWGNTSKDISSGRLGCSDRLGDEWIYWNLFDKDEAVKENSLRCWIMKRLKEDRLMDIFTGKSRKGEVVIEVNCNDLLCLRHIIEVKITDNRTTLFSPLRFIMGFDLTNQVTVFSRGTLQDPSELIRTLDWGADMYSEYISSNPDGGLAEAARKIEEIKIKSIGILN